MGTSIWSFSRHILLGREPEEDPELTGEIMGLVYQWYTLVKTKQTEKRRKERV